ncbi:hypothetical protein CYMTET_46277 [Cymbomonas tetramitiformis]|nr:hypothetical protein CYMTET_46277 [Cymbomonas tetramitiformis]
MDQSVEKNVKRAEAIKDSLIKNMSFPEFDITYDGLGMMGFGLISGRIHDSPIIDLMRETIERTCKQCSRQLNYYNPVTGDFSGYVVNKIIIGTLNPMQRGHEVHLKMLETFRKALSDTQGDPVTERVTATSSKNTVQLVHYNNEMLSSFWQGMENPIHVFKPFRVNETSNRASEYAEILRALAANLPIIVEEHNEHLTIDNIRNLIDQSYKLYESALNLQRAKMWSVTQGKVGKLRP